MNLDDAIQALRVRPGEPITARLWNGLMDLCAELARSYGQITTGKGIRLHQYPQGINIVAEGTNAAFNGSFAVRIVGDLEATIGLGLLNGTVPTIKRLPIDGVLADGTLKEPPRLSLKSGPNNQLRSWVALEVKVDAEGDLLADDPDAISIIHANDLSAVADPSIGRQALAMIVWSDKTMISRVHQIVYFNQQHQAVINPATKKLRHLFFAAS